MNAYDSEREPDFTKPVDVRAFLSNKLHFCGCFEDEEAIGSLTRFLEWADHRDKKRPYVGYETMYESVGVFYLVAALLDGAGLITHGISIRCPFLDTLGMALLDALHKHGWEAIAEAEGEAYDGCWYGDMGSGE